jgi:transposase
MAKIAKRTKRYPSDLTDEEWDRIAPLMPRPGRRGRPREVDFREVINAVRYLVRSGCGWRMLPIHFGPWQTVYGWFRELARRFLFQTIHDVALMADRERAGREASPTAGVIDSQSVKAPHAETRGYDAGKKIVGRKRHIAVDTDGRLLMVNLTPADISDSAGAQMILEAIRKRWPWVKHLFADGAYDRLKLMDKAAYLDFVIEIIRRSDDRKGFEVLPRRWVVERTFGWMIRWRRLVRRPGVRTGAITLRQSLDAQVIGNMRHGSPPAIQGAPLYLRRPTPGILRVIHPESVSDTFTVP